MGHTGNARQGPGARRERLPPGAGARPWSRCSSSWPSTSPTPAPASSRATPCARPSAAPPSSSTSRAPLHLSWEPALNQIFAVSRGLSLFGSFWYATAHYVVTAVVLVWLYRRGADAYVPARRALLVGTIIALVAYLLLPTAPPRLFGGYADVLALTSGDGWWGGDASAPKGLGGLTNQLAAFPSLHAGWALWVAMVLQRHAPYRWMRIAGWAHAFITGLVVVGTGNHWVADVLIGWLVIWLGFELTSGADRRPSRPGASAPCAPRRDRSWPTWAGGWP